MKVRLFLFSVAIVSILSAGSEAVGQTPKLNGGPGIVLVGSQNTVDLPKEAQKFINKHFKGIEVAKCDRFFAQGKYEVELANGVDIEFNSKGNVMEVDAPDGALLPASLVKDLLPHKAYHRLLDAGYANLVESIEFSRRGKAVEVELRIPDPDTYMFDIDGDFISISD